VALFIFRVVKNFVVYRSSAGSGKTFTLVRQYLCLALHDPKRVDYAYRRILAITFTNKAAAEMKSRVVSALSSICEYKELPDIGKMLLTDLTISETELRLRAASLLESILHNYSDFSIGTIDSFTHRLVRTFAFDLKLPAGFNVELNTSEFYSKVISRLLNSLGEDEKLSMLLKEYAIDKTEENTSWDPESSLLDFSKMLSAENAETYLVKLRKYSDEQLEEERKKLLKECREYKQHIQTEGRKAIHFINRLNINETDLVGKSRSPISFFKKCAQFKLNDKLEYKTLEKTIANNKWVSALPNAEEINNQLTATANELLLYILKHHEGYLLNKIVSNNIYPLMLLRRIETITEELKEEERVVFISEFNQRIHALIKNEPAPFIYERLGERYRHYLIDEFQDTSTMQWQNILPLIENTLSAGNFNLIVGDGKQSIYRWRNANVKQFASLPETDLIEADDLLKERTQVLKQHFEEEPLNNNYRSTRDVIEFNNAFFKALKERHSEEVQTIYKGHEQGVINPARGFITLNSENTAKSEFKIRNCEHALLHIQNALAAGYAYRDIAVIVRKNTHGNQIADYLTSNNIPVVSSDSLLLKNSTEVNVLINFLKCLEQEHHQIPAAAILNYVFHREWLTNETLHEKLLELSQGYTLFHILKQLELLPETEGLNLLDQVATLAERLEFPETSAPYVRFFLDVVNEFMITEGGSPGYFLEWWDRKKERASLIIPDHADAVRIMTIHASKGLEFPVVICPFFNWEFFRPDYTWVNLEANPIGIPASIIKISSGASQAGLEKDFTHEQSQQVLDNVNLLYVAFTRAAERLHIITCKSEANKKQEVGQWITPFFQANGQMLGDDYYCFGEAQPKSSKPHKQVSNSLLLPAFEASRIRQAVAVRNSKFESDNNARQEGIVLHWLLSKLTPEIELQDVLNLAIRKGVIHREQATSIALQLATIQKKIQEWMHEAIETIQEAELITANGEILRPDLVIVKPNSTLLVDYKSGKKEKKHVEQMQAYMDALHAMHYKNIQGTLLYLTPLEQVDLKPV
jgi:ATP-dependent exoDNAse (exonuclease V) beta subunit